MRIASLICLSLLITFTDPNASSNAKCTQSSYGPFAQYIHNLPTIWNAVIFFADDAARGRDLQAGSEFCAQGPAFMEAPSMCRTIEWATLASVSGILCPPLCHLGREGAGGPLGPCLGIVSHVVHNSRDISRAHGLSSQAVRPFHRNTWTLFRQLIVTDEAV